MDFYVYVDLDCVCKYFIYLKYIVNVEEMYNEEM